MQQNEYGTANQDSKISGYDVENENENKNETNKKKIIIIVAVLLVIAILLAIILPVSIRKKNGDLCKSNPSECTEGAKNSITMELDDSSTNLRMLEKYQLFGEGFKGLLPERVEDSNKKKLKVNKDNQITNMEPGTKKLNLYYVTKLIEDASNMYKGVKAKSVDLSKLNLTAVTSTEGMFQDSQIKDIKFTPASTLRVLEESESDDSDSEDGDSTNSTTTILQNVTTIKGMFNGSSAQELDVTLFETKNCNDSSYSFANTQVIIIIFPKRFYLGKNIEGAFKGSSKLTNISTESFVSNYPIESMDGLFEGCTSIEVIMLPRNLDTSKVPSMKNVFKGMKKLRVLKLDIDLGGIKEEKDMEGFLDDCGNSIEEFEIGDMGGNVPDTIKEVIVIKIIKVLSPNIKEEKMNFGVALLEIKEKIGEFLVEYGTGNVKKLDITKISFKEYSLDNSPKKHKHEENEKEPPKDSDSDSDTDTDTDSESENP